MGIFGAFELRLLLCNATKKIFLELKLIFMIALVTTPGNAPVYPELFGPNSSNQEPLFGLDMGDKD